MARGEAAGLPGGVPAVRPGDLPCLCEVVHPDGVPADDAQCPPQRQPRGVGGGGRGEGRLAHRRSPARLRLRAGSPLERLCEAGGEVLLLGTPLNTVTLLHYAESLADVPGKRTVRYRQPILVDGRKTWVEVEEYDTSNGIKDWPDGDYSVAIVEGYLAAGHGRAGLVGAARSYLFDARDLTAFAVAWMERAFGMTSGVR